MEKLETIFGTEREVMIAQELLQNLVHLREPIVAFDLASRNSQAERLAKGLPGPPVWYNCIFSILVDNGYIQIAHKGLSEEFHPSWSIVRVDDARKFFQTNYERVH